MEVRTPTEMTLMVLITGITNMACFPAMYVVFKKRMLFQLYMGVFTFVTSFMYHVLDSLQAEGFYLSTGDWHQLDNIGSIMCFIMLCVYWMDNPGSRQFINLSPSDLHFLMLGLFLTLLMQQQHPWKLENTVVPILVYACLLVGKLICVKSSRFNRYYMIRSCVLMLLGICCFIKGLDEQQDYLRLWHGMWHCFVGLSAFFSWQSIENDDAPKIGAQDLLQGCKGLLSIRKHTD